VFGNLTVSSLLLVFQYSSPKRATFPPVHNIFRNCRPPGSVSDFVSLCDPLRRPSLSVTRSHPLSPSAPFRSTPLSHVQFGVFALGVLVDLFPGPTQWRSVPFSARAFLSRFPTSRFFGPLLFSPGSYARSTIGDLPLGPSFCSYSSTNRIPTEGPQKPLASSPKSLRLPLDRWSFSNLRDSPPPPCTPWSRFAFFSSGELAPRPRKGPN